jgi:hypothetical protein
MQIKTEEGTRSVGSQGVAGTALGLGIAGTVGLLNQWANGGSILGGGVSRNGGAIAVGATDAIMNTDTRTIGALQAELGKEQSERYTDSVGIDLYKSIISEVRRLEDNTRENFAELVRKNADMDKQIAVDGQKTADNFAFLNQKIDDKNQQLFEYVNATFVPGVLKMPLDSVCPKPMQRYNTWEAPTDTATKK